MTSGADKLDYAQDIFPILEMHCIGCHTEDDAEGGLAMDSHAALMRGGDGGMAITAGVPANSRMLLMVSGKLEPRMPPEDDGPSEEDLAILAAWVEQGAVGPQGDVLMKRTLRTPKIATSDTVKKPITAIAISSDATLQAIAQFNRVDVIQLGKPNAAPTTFTGDFGKVTSVRFSNDHTKILIATGLTGAYGVAAVYSVSDGEMQREFLGHRDLLYAAEFSPDERIIATAGYDRKIILWNADTGEKLRELKGHNGAIFGLSFSPNGKVLASACADETVKIWNVKSGERLDTLGQPEGEVYCVSISHDGKHIVAGSRDNRLRVWRLISLDQPATNPLIVTRYLDDSPITQFAWTQDGKRIVVMSESEITSKRSMPTIGRSAKCSILSVMWAVTCLSCEMRRATWTRCLFLLCQGNC